MCKSQFVLVCVCPICELTYMIEEIEKKLAVEKARLARLDASQKKCMEKINDYEATIRVLAELNGAPAEEGKDKKKTAADHITQALKGLGKPVNRHNLTTYLKIIEGIEINENTVVGTLQRLRTNGAVDCKDNLWSLKQSVPPAADKPTEEDDEIPF